MKKPQTHKSIHLIPKSAYKAIAAVKIKEPKPRLRYTVSNSDSFPVFFSECSSHWCQVIVHPTLRRLRRGLYGWDCGKDLRSGCVTHQEPRDSLIATIHLCREALVCSHICHETLHAAWHRAKVLGVKDEDDFQEFVAYGQASLMVQIADWIASQNQFQCHNSARQTRYK